MVWIFWNMALLGYRCLDLLVCLCYYVILVNPNYPFKHQGHKKTQTNQHIEAVTSTLVDLQGVIFVLYNDGFLSEYTVYT